MWDLNYIATRAGPSHGYNFLVIQIEQLISSEMLPDSKIQSVSIQFSESIPSDPLALAQLLTLVTQSSTATKVGSLSVTNLFTYFLRH